MKNLDEMRCNPVFIKAAGICDTHGYVLNRMLVNEHGVPSLHIKEKEDGYHPPIYVIEEDAKCDKFKYEIQTTSYGALDTKEYLIFMNACSDAYRVVELLSAIDFATWPQVEGY